VVAALAALTTPTTKRKFMFQCKEISPKETQNAKEDSFQDTNILKMKTQIQIKM
jgi:hypothetical protein